MQTKIPIGAGMTGRRKALWVFMICTLTGLLFFVQGAVTTPKEKVFDWQKQLCWAMVGWYLWGLFFPVISRLTHRFPVNRHSYRKSLPVHFAAAFVISFIHALIQAKVDHWLPFMPKIVDPANLFNGFFVGMVMWRVLLYTTIACICHALEYQQKYRESELQATQIEARILRAQMEALKMQLDPDFLFETLHSVKNLMKQDLSLADKMIARLGDFLRLTLDFSGTNHVPLRREIEFLKCYLEIQKLRLPGGPSVQLQVEPDALDARIPNLLLYSLVEGTMERAGGMGATGTIQLRIVRKEEGMRVEAVDPFPLQADPAPNRSDLHERMQQVYGSGFRMLTTRLKEGGQRTVVDIPLLEETEDEILEPEWVDSSGPADEKATELEWFRRIEVPDHPEPQVPHRWWRPYLWSGGAFSVLGLFFLLRTVLIMRLNHEPFNFTMETNYLGMWYIWALVAPYIISFSRKFPLTKGVLLRNTALHLVNNAVLILPVTTLLSGSLWWLTSATPKGLFLFLADELRFSDFAIAVLLYWTIVAIGHASRSYREYRKGEIRAIRLRAQLSRAQLQALKMQLHPHFLFNTLNSISELMQEDLPTAEQMMSHLEHFLRLTIRNSDAQEVPFETELEFLKCYLDIEHVRFQDRLNIRMDIAPQALEVPVPNLLLQPIVENAIRHGIAPRTSAGQIDIRAVRTEGKLQVQVQDNGPGMATGTSANQRKGLGLSNTRERLQQLYGRSHRFQMENAPEGGLLVTLEIPVEKQA